MPTDLGQATLVAQLPDLSTTPLKADVAQALTVADTTARTLLSTIAAFLDAMATLGETQPVSVASLPLPTGAATQTTLAAVLAALATVPVTGPLTDAQLRATALAVSTGLVQPLTDAQLRAAALAVSGTVALDSATLAALETINSIISGSVAVTNFPATQAVTGPITDAQLRASKVTVADDYQGGEVLADQAGVGGVLTFTFTSAVQLVVVHARGLNLVARADPFGGVPASSQGIICGDDIPTYIPVATSSVKVFAPAGMTVTVHGMRRA